MAAECICILKLLGLDFEKARQKYSLASNIDGKTLFSRPNPKTFEVIIHFLLERFDHNESQKVIIIIKRIVNCGSNCVFSEILQLLAHI